MDIDVKTFTKNDDDFLLICMKINEFLQNENITDKRKENYTRSNMKISDSIAVSIYVKNGNILGFSNMVHRDLFNSGLRILNRFYKSKTYRFVNDKRVVSDETKQMIKQQLEVAKTFNFDFAFMSREGRITPPAFRHYQTYLSFAKWHIEEKKHRICNGNSDCNQFIIWTPLVLNANFNLISVKDEEC